MKKKAPFENKRIWHLGLKTGIVVEEITTRLVMIRYRDSKGRLSAFTKKKKLSVEVVFEKKLPHQKWKRFVSSSYSLPLKKRQRPVPENVIQRQIHRRLKAKAKRGHYIVAPQLINGLWSWKYKYYEVVKKKDRKVKRKKLQRDMQGSLYYTRKKGSSRGRATS